MTDEFLFVEAPPPAAEPTAYEREEVGHRAKNDWKQPLIWLGASVGHVGLLFAMFGHAIRALFYLPGRTVTKGELDW